MSFEQRDRDSGGGGGANGGAGAGGAYEGGYGRGRGRRTFTFLLMLCDYAFSSVIITMLVSKVPLLCLRTTLGGVLQSAISHFLQLGVLYHSVSHTVYTWSLIIYHNGGTKGNFPTVIGAIYSKKSICHWHC
jgi:hypothetical protein